LLLLSSSSFHSVWFGLGWVAGRLSLGWAFDWEQARLGQVLEFKLARILDLTVDSS
jgi:hypothetical protein